MAISSNKNNRYNDKYVRHCDFADQRFASGEHRALVYELASPDPNTADLDEK